MRRRLIVPAIVALAALPAASATGASSATVRSGFSGGKFVFKPSTVTIKRGGKVTFKFVDGARHNVTPRGARRFTRVRDASSGSFTRRFAGGGTYRYICTIHGSSMSGRVVVR